MIHTVFHKGQAECGCGGAWSVVVVTCQWGMALTALMEVMCLLAHQLLWLFTCLPVDTWLQYNKKSTQNSYKTWKLSVACKKAEACATVLPLPQDVPVKTYKLLSDQ
jgi:hypothetical protein